MYNEEQVQQVPEVRLPEVLLHLAGVIRGAELLVHSAHHRAYGSGFAGDHMNLLNELYELLGEQLDKIVERAIGLTGDSTLGDANAITTAALSFMQQFPLDEANIVGSVLNVCKAVTAELEKAHADLESSGQLTLGLSDLLPELASEHERFCYLLSQRVKLDAPVKVALWQHASGAFSKLMDR